MSDAGAGPLFLGLISGTSADGIDAALVGFEPELRLHAAHTFPYDAALRSEVLRLSQAQQPLWLDELGTLDRRIGRAFADAANALLERSGVARDAVRAIGSHGQTLRHRPLGDDPFTLQLGDPTQIAEATRLPVVADFRRRDMAAGGQGAPLAPAFHTAWLRSPDEPRAVLNIGGIANLTLLPTRGPVLGFDTGPGNGLMDAWCLQHLGHSYDASGTFAASGRVDQALLARLLADPYFALPAPKSTGRDYFHAQWLQAQLGDTTATPADVQATLLELSARSIADALRRTLPGAARLLVCGGGVHNLQLMARLAALLPGARVESTAAQGVDPDFLEAMAFAWLARETLAGRPGNLHEVTGAAGPRVLGAIYPA